MENDDNETPGNRIGTRDEVYSNEMGKCDANSLEVLEGIMEDLTKVELDLAYSSEKLVNYHVLLMCLLTQERDFESLISEDDYILDDSIEKALAFDLLSGFLDLEVRELDNFMDTLHAEIENARHKISSCRHPKEVVTALEDKLLDSEASLKQSRQQILEVTMQSTKLQRIVLSFRDGNGKFNEDVDICDNIFACNMNGTSNQRINEQYRHVLRMLEKSLSRELDLEKELSESRKREEEMRLKLHYTEQVALQMEEAAEVVWGRFLEVDNRAEVLMGISTVLVGQIQIIQFNLKCLIQRENEMKAKFQDYEEQLEEKGLALQRLETSKVENYTNSAELAELRKEVKSLEKQLEETKNFLKIANSSNTDSQEQLIEMENLVDSLKESLVIEEGRAENAEMKLAQLTESNLEIAEELNFLKDSATNKEKKVGSLEKQLREVELQLQHAKASMEAGQEQQNMLYNAIWDMETLIEDLKSKVSKAESKTDNVEEQCIILSESNIELNKEVDSLKSRVEFLETSLDKANAEKYENSKEIGLRSKYIMDLVTKLAIERERIEKQLSTLSNGDNVLIKEALDKKSSNNGMNIIGTAIIKEITTQRSHRSLEGDEEPEIKYNKAEGRSAIAGTKHEAAKTSSLLRVCLPILVLLIIAAGISFFSSGSLL